MGLAIVAALCFGATTPVIVRAGRGLGPFVTAALLYAGASLSAFLLGRLWPSAGVPLRARQLGRLGVIALLGAGIAPAALAWGLQRAGATAGSLLLNLETVFTVVLAALIFREAIGRRVAVAVAAMVLGGVALAFGDAQREAWGWAGVLAIVGATLAWALDNLLTRALAENDPTSIVALKGLLGATLTTLVAFVAREPLPTPRVALILLAAGATGYGLSLRLYLVAQRHLGAARTASIFAVGPFFGAGLAFALGDRAAGGWSVLAAGLFALGVVLHLTEHHHHRHRHLAVTHEHPHRHDDGHHFHAHAEPVVGEHSHAHHHPTVEHDHDHAPDLHHDHVH